MRKLKCEKSKIINGFLYLSIITYSWTPSYTYSQVNTKNIEINATQYDICVKKITGKSSLEIQNENNNFIQSRGSFNNPAIQNDIAKCINKFDKKDLSTGNNEQIKIDLQKKALFELQKKKITEQKELENVREIVLGSGPIKGIPNGRMI